MTHTTDSCEVSKAAQKMCDGASEMKTAVVAQSSDAIEQCRMDTEASIRENPYKSLMIAVGIGAVLGALAFRR